MASGLTTDAIAPPDRRRARHRPAAWIPTRCRLDHGSHARSGDARAVGTLREVGIDHLGPRSLRQLLDAVLAIGSELDLDRALTHIVETAATLVDARYGALGVLDEARSGLWSFITVGIDDDARRAIGPLPKGLGLLGSLISDAHPLRVPVIAESPNGPGSHRTIRR